MQTGWRSGSLFKIPLFWTPVVCDSSVSNPELWVCFMEWGTVLAWSAGLVMALLLFGGVVAFGHSLVARSGHQSKLDYPIFLWRHRFNRRRIETLDKHFKWRS